VFIQHTIWNTTNGKIRIAIFLAIAGALAPSACKSEIGEKTAIANFKAEVEVTAKSPNTESEVALDESLANLSEGIKKLQSIRFDNLPACLKTAWAGFAEVM